MSKEKVNDNPPISLSGEAMYMDRSPITAGGGGVAVDGETYYSVARSDMMPGNEPAMPTVGGWAVPSHRARRMSILQGSSGPATYGAELEHVRLDEDGRYTDYPTDELLQINELYTFMGESGTQPTDDPVDFERLYRELLTQEVEKAEAVGQFVAALAVYGQYRPKPDQLSPSIYVRHVVGAMTDRTGFDTVETFRVGGFQPHTGISDTMAGVKATETMQYLSPILMAPTLSAPLINDGPSRPLSPMQIKHMRESGVNIDDLSGPYQSRRYLLRRISSPSAGIWQHPAPDTMEDYLRVGHEDLASGKINNIDRSNGWHTDRVRVVLDGSGANTVEDCSADPALGKPETLVALHMLRSALINKFEAMALQGNDPREAVARELGVSRLSLQERLEFAHRLSLREVARYGNDANTYRRLRPGQWLDWMLAAAEGAPTRLTGEQKSNLRKMYATWDETEPELRRWCRDNGEDAPSSQAYFALGLNNPAVYMRAEYENLRDKNPDATKEELIREVELGAAKALHRHMRQTTKAPARNKAA